MALSQSEIERTVKWREEEDRKVAEANQRALQLKQQREAQQQQKAKAAEAASRQQKQQEQQKQNRSNTINRAAQTAQPQQRQAGWVTQIGQAVDSAISGDWINDGANAIAAGINQVTPDNWVTKDFTQSLDDNTLSSQEIKDRQLQINQRVEKTGNPVEKFLAGTANNLEAVAEGMQAGLNIPATVAARIANQANPWSDPPAIIKDSPIGETLFEVAQILTPTLIGGGVVGGLGKASISSTAVGLGAESAVETATQDNFDELIGGRSLAGKLGELADHLGYDGEQFARELVEGKTINSQVLTAVVGFAQNFGINAGADGLARFFGKSAIKALDNGSSDKAAQVLGRNVDEVENASHSINEPRYTPDTEPHEAFDIDTGVSKPSKGSEALNRESLVKTAVNPGIAEDSTTAAGRSYFTNWGAITDDDSLQRVLQEATSTLKRLKGFPDDMKLALGRASKWWFANKDLIGGDTKQFHEAASNFLNLVKPLDGKLDAMQDSLNKGAIYDVFREYSATTEEGFIAASLVGEELGVRIKEFAKQASSLEAGDIDFTAAIENILQLHDKANLFLIPLRRGKRKWAVEGTLQQRKALARVKDADIKGALTKADKVSYDAPSRSFETIKVDDADPGSTLRELYERYQGGDDSAGATLKAYVDTLAHSDPSTAVSQVENLSTVLKDQLKKGNSEARTNIFYASMLSRASTQAASAASNIVRLVGEPIGSMISLNAPTRAYGFGQFVGGWQVAADSWEVYRQALKTGRALNGGVKFDNEVLDSAKQLAAEDELFTARIKQLNEKGVTGIGQLGAHLNHWIRWTGSHPWVHTPARLLLGADEMSKVIVGNQVAVGRAYKTATEKGITDPDIIQDLVNLELSKVFRDGVRIGKITDADVLAAAEDITFTKNIPGADSQYVNFVDNAFNAVNDAASKSGFWRVVSPFTRVSYNILEATTRHSPAAVLLPKYRAILRGEMGEVAQLQLKSQIRMGTLFGFLAGSAAATGFVTGVNSGNLPKQSFIVPANNKDGYIAFSYAKMEPFATITSVIADVVNGYKNEIIGQGAYDQFVADLVLSLGMASFDKTFMSGMADFGSMFDAKNLSQGSVTGFANVTAGLVPAGGLIRMISNWSYPYKTIKGVEGDAWQNFAGAFRQRTIGGIGNPKLYDELTGKPIPTVATIDKGDNPWLIHIGAVLNEFVPSRTSSGTYDSVKKELDAVNFTHDSYSSIRNVGGVALNPEQQSILSKDIHDVGNLRGKLIGYFDSDQYKTLKSQFNAMRKADSRLASSNEGTRASVVRDMIHQDLRTIWRAAKDEALTKGRLSNDPSLVLKRQGAQDLQLLIPPAAGVNSLLNWGNY